ncbi:MAG: DUF362 domain-containing protein [Dehalococcoidia bacterium]|nr:DUF362 domain-containing protein [Dehalococcoidia bacterium]
MVVSVVRMAEPLQSLREAIALCDGFARLRTHDRVLVKPNASYGLRVPHYGTTTTTTILEGLIRLLAERGCRDISIAEGSLEVLGCDTQKAFARTQIDKLAKRYGTKLIDLNRGPFQQEDLGGVKVQIAKAALETDFLINVPVLKTHYVTKVSLSFKNLKGCLSPASKNKFHVTKRLNHLIYLLNEVLRSDLTVIDGTYMLEAGPEIVLGTAHRKNLIIAGQDGFACDVVGATILGIDPSEVGYLREYAEAHGRSLSVDAIQIRGERDIDALREKLNWRADAERELLAPAGITGLSLPYPGESCCSKCYAMLGMSLVAFIKENSKRDFGDAAIYCGGELEPEADRQKTILYGNCATKKNSLRPHGAMTVKGCPPRLTDTLFALCKLLLSRPRALRVMPVALLKLAGAGVGIYNYKLPKWKTYESDMFEKRHFALSRRWPAHKDIAKGGAH